MEMAVLDANVLYPAPVRDYLLHLAEMDLYFPKWTEEIHNEWIRSLLLQRKDIGEKSLLSAKKAMNEAFPLANIINYKYKIKDLELPDKYDEHVLAAAIISGTKTIVTFNTRDFPAAAIDTFGIRAIHPDLFILELIRQDEHMCLHALKTQTSRLKHPPKKINDVLTVLSQCGLKKSMEQISSFIQLSA